VQQQTGASRLRLLIVGAPGSGRFSLANVLLNRRGLLPASPIPRSPVSVHVRYGEGTTVEGVGSDGIVSLIAPENLRQFLTAPDSNAESYQQLHITTDSDILRNSNLRIESIGARRSASEWKEMLAGSDFTLLVLNALALLSEQEKRFIRDLLQPGFGLERVAIIINQMDLVAEDERASITELVRMFLGAFERQPSIIEFSAAQAIAGMDDRGGGAIPPSSGYDTLLRLVRDDLLGRHRALRTAAMQQAATLCLNELESAVQRHLALLGSNEADLKQMLGQLDPQSEWLKSRTERAQHRIDAFVNTLLKEQCLRDIEAFSASLREQLPGEVMSVGKVEDIKRHLPGYIEAVWGEFFTYLMPPLRNQLFDEMLQVSDSAAADVRELLGTQAVPFQEALHSFAPIPSSMKAFLMPARGHHPAGSTATWMQVGGLALLIPLPQISLALLGVGQAVRMLFQRDIAAADKRAIIGSVTSATYELERQIKQQVESHFHALAQELKQTVASLYEQGIASIRTSLEASIAQHGDVAGQQQQVEHLAETTIPELRQMLERLTGGKAA
jgi:hypothetical protein